MGLESELESESVSVSMAMSEPVSGWVGVRVSVGIGLVPELV